MPITTPFNSAVYHKSTSAILIEHLRDYFSAAEYVVIDEQPSLENLAKPTIWFQMLPSSTNIEPRTRRGGKTLQRKRLNFTIGLATSPTTGGLPKIRDMAATFERNAVLRDAYKLAEAGLRQVQVTPFYDVGSETQAKQYRKTAILTLVVYVEAE